MSLIKHKFRKIYDGTRSIRASDDLFYQSILLAHRWDYEVCATEFDHDGNGLSESAGC